MVEQQKKVLLDSISLQDEELKERYIKLGELHGRIRVPCKDYMASINMLRGRLIHVIAELVHPLELLEATTDFFSLIRAFSAKGYLNTLQSDIRDFEFHLAHVHRVAQVDISLSTECMATQAPLNQQLFPCTGP